MNTLWSGREVFITGGNGFLGSHLTRELIRHGARPVVLIFEDNPDGLFESEGLDRHAKVVRGDVRNSALMERVLHEHRIDTIFHLAAQAIVDQALEDPLTTFESNIQGTWNVLMAAKKSPTVKRIIVASSDKAYGAHTQLPYLEDHRLAGIYPYEVSKVCADLLCQSFHKTFGLPVCITRCANLYGPGDTKSNRIIPNTISRLARREPPIIRDSGHSTRDYLFVEDAAEAYRLLGERMGEELFGEAFNFSTNTPYTVAEVIALLSEAMNVSIAPLVTKTHGTEIEHQHASFEKAKKLLGWEPRHTLKEGLQKTIPWYAERSAGASAAKLVHHGERELLPE